MNEYNTSQKKAGNGKKTETDNARDDLPDFLQDLDEDEIIKIE